MRENTVIHHIEMSDFPNYVGKDLVRYVTRDGDKLILTSPPMLLEGEEQTVVNVWQKIANNA